MLEVRDISFSYNGKPVLSNVSLSLRPGESLCLLGPNGSGKTTFFKTILGLLKLQQGRIIIDGADASTWSREQMAKKIGYIPQINHISFPFSVFDVVLMGRAAHVGSFSLPSKKDLEAVSRAIDMLGITHLSDKAFTEISGGERQLVLIARALAQEPQILIMDEPTSNLDYGNQVKILSYIKKLVSRGLIVIMSSHFPDHAFLYATKVALMKNGRLCNIGKPNEIMTEESLKDIYGIDIKIGTTYLANGEEVRVCVPLLH